MKVRPHRVVARGLRQFKQLIRKALTYGNDTSQHCARAYRCAALRRASTSSLSFTYNFQEFSLVSAMSSYLRSKYAVLHIKL